MVVEGAGEPVCHYTLDLLTTGPQSVAIEFVELAKKKIPTKLRLTTYSVLRVPLS